MNKHLFKSLQTEKKEKLNELYYKYHRMERFYNIANSQAKNWTLTQYNNFWYWYEYTDVNAEFALRNIEKRAHRNW